MKDNLDAWRWIDGHPQQDPQSQQHGQEISRCFARVFSHHDAHCILQHLRKSTRERVFGPTVSEATLRYVEGQRALVAYMETMIERGRANSQETAK